MIPCSTQNGASPDMAGQASDMQAMGSEEENGILDLSGLDSPGDLFLSPTYLLDSWTEALLKDNVSHSSAVTDKQGAVSSTVVNKDIRDTVTDGLETPSYPVFIDSPAQAAPLRLGLESEAEVPLAIVPTGFQIEQPITNKTLQVETVSASSTNTGATLVDSLEESNKIIAEIPSILTAYLDGGQLTGNPLNKMCFNESKLGSKTAECSTVGQKQGNENSKGGDKDGTRRENSLKAESFIDSFSCSERMCPQPQEDDVFQAIPEVFPQIPEVQDTNPDRIIQTNGIGERDSKVTSESQEATDVFSWQFESILESERLCSTLYSSLDSLEALSSSADDEADVGFTFDMPLTPMIQQRLKEPAHFLDLTSGRQEVLSVMATGKSGKAALEVTSSYQETLSSSSGFTSRSDGHSAGALANGMAENAEQEAQHWLHGCMSDAGLTAALSEWDPDMGSVGRLKDSTDTLHNGSRGDQEAAQRLARRLYHLEGFRRSDVAKHLGKNNDFSKMVAEEYLTFFEFTGMTLDQSLRSFLAAFALRGETQERERVLIHFSNRYYKCNPTTISSQDGVHCLTCALMLLNTDLHGHNIGKKMTCQEFISNLDGLNRGHDFPQELLKALYSSIKNEKLEWAIDGDELQKSLSELTDKTDSAYTKSIARIGSGSNPFLDITHDPNAAVYKTGFLARKIHADMDGKKTPRGKRSWKTFYAVLKGMILYLQKDEYKPEKALSEEDLKNAISIHHSLSIKAMDYEKKPNVLKLKTADWRVFLFQAQTPEEMDSWIRVINSVAALFSAPSFPAAIGSQKKFSRPLLPATTTRMSREEQLKSHEAKLKHVSTELAEHKSYPPDKKVKAKESDEYKLKEHYLEFEENRYEMYVKLLREGMKDLLVGNDGEAALKKSQSSPSLTQESQPAMAKVKRNISERKDYRHESPKVT
ncbi:PH and SEC7 domain-containing protein 1 isoform 2-T2 [Polymixia lowei]